MYYPNLGGKKLKGGLAAEVTGDAGIIEEFLSSGKVFSGGEGVSFNIIFPVEHFVFFTAEMMKG
ncbi:MAG: hypothetical protein GYA14_11445, partial [Ignavibacteria bacterium]|nr:hypothetical protein [Ignavibacteria bacterium]